MIWTIIGWIVWVFTLLTAIYFTQLSRNFIKNGGDSAKTDFGIFVLEATFNYIALILFLIYPWSKLHLIWIWLLIAFGAPLLLLPGFPLLTPIIVALTRKIVLPIMLIGIDMNRAFSVSSAGQNLEAESENDGGDRKKSIEKLNYEQWRDQLASIVEELGADNPEVDIRVYPEHTYDHKAAPLFTSRPNELQSTLSRLRNKYGKGVFPVIVFVRGEIRRRFTLLVDD
jgi:hypothetical protein